MAQPAPPTNFFKLCQVLHYVCKETAPEVEAAIRSWHSNQIQGGHLLQCVGAAAGCRQSQSCKPKRQLSSCSNCILCGSTLEKAAYKSPKSVIAWKNVNAHHLYTNPIEIAKAFALHLPSGQIPTKIEHLDPASILKIMLGFGEFHRRNHGTSNCPDPYGTIQKVNRVRNNLAHSDLKGDLHISDQDMKQHLQDVEDFITCLEELQRLNSSQSAHMKTKVMEISSSPILFTSEMKTALCDVLQQTATSLENIFKLETGKIHQGVEEIKQIQMDSRKDSDQKTSETKALLVDVKDGIHRLEDQNSQSEQQSQVETGRIHQGVEEIKQIQMDSRKDSDQKTSETKALLVDVKDGIHRLEDQNSQSEQQSQVEAGKIHQGVKEIKQIQMDSRKDSDQKTSEAKALLVDVKDGIHRLEDQNSQSEQQSQVETGRIHQGVEEIKQNQMDSRKDSDQKTSEAKALLEDVKDGIHRIEHKEQQSQGEVNITVDESQSRDVYNVSGDQATITGDQVNVTRDQVNVTGDQVNVAGDQVNVAGDHTSIAGNQNIDCRDQAIFSGAHRNQGIQMNINAANPVLHNAPVLQSRVDGEFCLARPGIDIGSLSQAANVLSSNGNAVIVNNTFNYGKRCEPAEMVIRVELFQNIVQTNADLSQSVKVLTKINELLVEESRNKDRTIEALKEQVVASTCQPVGQEPMQRVSDKMGQSMFERTLYAVGSMFCRNAFGRLDRGSVGSILLYVRFGNRTELTNIWQAYRDGRLVENLTRVIITEDLEEKFGCRVHLDVKADEEEFQKGMRIFDQLEADKVVLPSSMSDWTIHHVRQFLLQEGISEEISNMIFEEEIDGTVFHGYTAEEMANDFKLLKKGPLRKILKARDRFLSQKQVIEEKPHLGTLASSSVGMSSEESHMTQTPDMKLPVGNMGARSVQDVGNISGAGPKTSASPSQEDDQKPPLDASSSSLEGMSHKQSHSNQKPDIKSSVGNEGKSSLQDVGSIPGAGPKATGSSSQEDDQKPRLDVPSSTLVGMSSEESHSHQKSDMKSSVASPETSTLSDTSSASGARPKVKATPSPQMVEAQALNRPLPAEKKVDVSTLSEAEKNLRLLLLSDESEDEVNLDNSYFPVLVANRPLLHSAQYSEEFEKCFSFISAINWSVVLDFNADSNKSGLARFYSRKSKARWQDPETIVPANLNISDVPLWMFCNGRQDDPNVCSPRLLRQEWREQRRESIENVISTFANPSVIPSGRAVTIFLILSDDDIGILSDAFSKFYTAFHGMANITCICADEGLYNLWAKEASSICGGAQVLRDRSIVGVPWNNINKFMKRIAKATEATTFTLPHARIPIDERKLQSWEDLSVVCKNECENTDMDENNPDFKAFKKDKELKFYRGHKVQWWNFAFNDQEYDHVLQRTVYNKLQAKVNFALQAGTNLVEVITIYHQAGSGGSTLAHHILWEFHRDYRCAVVNSLSSPDTARQILDLRKFGYTTEKECQPVLILADDLDELDLDQLQFDLETFSKDSMTSRATAVILQCKRTSEPQDMCSRESKNGSGRSGITVQHELDERERQWFQRKYNELERKVKTSNDYQPKNLIAFMAMKSEFNPKYIQSVVSDVLPDVQQHSEREYKLLTYTAIVNRYNADAVIPVYCCDEFMAKESCVNSPTPWEKTVSGSFNMLMIQAEVHVQNVGSVKGVKLVSQEVAEEITKQLAEEKDKPVADLTAELLYSNILGSQAYVKDRYLKPTIHNILIQRKMAPDGIMSMFSDLIEHVLLKEGYDKALNVLNQGYQTLNDPICAQQAARLCIRQQSYEKALEYIQLALQNVPKNSYFLHTKGEIYRNQIQDIDAQHSVGDTKARLPVDEIERICRLGFSGIKTFKDCQRYAEEENRDNLYGCFGEVEISLTLIDSIYRMEPFSGTGPQEQLKKYLLTEAIPDGLEELTEFHEDFKKLKESIDKALADIENYTTLFKDKVRSRYGEKPFGVLQQHSNLVKGFRKDYARFFGVPPNSTPPENPADIPEWNRARVVALGADSVYDIFELASDRNNEENRAKLREVYNLLSQIKPAKFKDLRLLICSILALSCMDVQGIEDLPSVDNVHELVRRLNEKSARADVIGPFFRLMFLWPHPNATSHRLKYNGELRYCAEDLRNRWDEKVTKKQNRSQKIDVYNPTWHQNRPRQKPRTFFFLANGKGLRQFAHIHELKATQNHLDSDRDQFWDQPDVIERLTLLNGTLYNNNLLSYKTQTGEIIRITLSKPQPCRTVSQEPVEFYLGFSWSGPRAYNVKYIEPVKEEQLQPTKQGGSQLAIEPWTSTYSTQIDNRIKELRKQKMDMEVLQDREKKTLKYKERQKLKDLPKVKSELRKLLEKKKAQEKI
ncbi:uncharacterized protein [Amphiura filiformis]|uniref:uncharacterized protein n=1 Tax=Amphiura filiformis TaxID=82378 RepID=UPI003B226ECD